MIVITSILRRILNPEPKIRSPSRIRMVEFSVLQERLTIYHHTQRDPLLLHSFCAKFHYHSNLGRLVVQENDSQATPYFMQDSEDSYLKSNNYVD